MALVLAPRWGEKELAAREKLQKTVALVLMSVLSMSRTRRRMALAKAPSGRRNLQPRKA